MSGIATASASASHSFTCVRESISSGKRAHGRCVPVPRPNATRPLAHCSNQTLPITLPPGLESSRVFSGIEPCKMEPTGNTPFRKQRFERNIRRGNEKEETGNRKEPLWCQHKGDH